MNRKFWPVVVAAIVLGMGAPYVVRAQPVQSPKDPIGMYVQAGATPEQQDKIRELAKEFETTAKVKTERAGNLLRKLQKFSLEPMPDEKEVVATQSEFNTLQADISMARIKLMLQIRGLLTDEQRGKLVQLLKDQYAQQGAGM